MENLSQVINDRIRKDCGETQAELLKFCQLQMVVVQEKSALMIHCPNAWTAKRINELLIGNLDLILHNLGIDRAIIAEGNNKIYYEWDLTNLSVKGYFINGDLNKLEILNIPTIEELEQMIGN